MPCLLRQNFLASTTDTRQSKQNLEKLPENEYTNSSRGDGEIRVCRRCFKSYPTYALTVLAAPSRTLRPTLCGLVSK